MSVPGVQLRDEMNRMRTTGGVLAFLIVLTAQNIAVAQIGNPMPPPGAVGDPVPAKTDPNKNLVRPPRHDKAHCHPHKGACLPKPS
jgi:hypothetical protein